MKVHPQSNTDSTGTDRPSTLLPIEADGFHAYVDAYALDGQWVIFLSMAGDKDSVKAIRARLLTNHWINVGVHEVCLLPRNKYGTNSKVLPSGAVHTAIFIKNDPDDLRTYYALTARPKSMDSDLYFTALVTHSAVPVHYGWKAWLYKRAIHKQQVETLTAQGIRGIKLALDDDGLAEDVSAALINGRLKNTFDTVLPFPKPPSHN
ncbi:MAG TPA: hypothetical protein VNM15_02855 [Candidatus Binatia bacterium]|nr:hypothetical protein [Candidatus Binatia bacterium]